MAEEQGLSADNRELIERVFGCKLSEPMHGRQRSLKLWDAPLNRLLDAARSEGLQPPVGGCEGKELGSVGSGLTPLVPSPSAAGLVAQPSEGAQ